MKTPELMKWHKIATFLHEKFCRDDADGGSYCRWEEEERQCVENECEEWGEVNVWQSWHHERWLEHAQECYDFFINLPE